MRGLIIAVLLATAAWTGYWWAGSTAIENGVTQFLASQPADQISVGSTEVHGIPNRFDLTLTEVEVTRPDLGLRWQSPFAQVFAMAWKPWHLIGALPPEQHIFYQGQDITLKNTSMMGDVIVHPSTALTLNEVVVETKDLSLASDQGWIIGLQTAVASLREDPSLANSYRLGLRARQLSPDASLLPALEKAGLPALVDEVYIDALANLTAPLDRNAAQIQPQLASLNLTDTRLTWGDLGLSARGVIQPDAQGFASGEIALELQNWQKLPPLLVALGVVQEKMQQTMTGMMGALAQQGGDDKVLKIKLIAANGRLSLGPFPLGDAPRMAPLVN